MKAKDKEQEWAENGDRRYAAKKADSIPLCRGMSIEEYEAEIEKDKQATDYRPCADVQAFFERLRGRE